MSDGDALRKLQLEAQVLAAAQLLLEHLRRTELPPAAILIPMDANRDHLFALGTAEGIAELLKNDPYRLVLDMPRTNTKRK